MKIDYKGIKASYTPHRKDNEADGILIIDLPNGVQSTHIVKGWSYIRIFQYIESFKNVV